MKPMECPTCNEPWEAGKDGRCASCGGSGRIDESGSDAPTCSLEVEISESRRRYITIEVTPDQADRICEWAMKYNPTAEEEQRAIELVKAAKVIKEEVMHDCYEIGCVEVLSLPENETSVAVGRERPPAEA